MNLQPDNQSFTCCECQGFGHYGRSCPSRRKQLNPAPSLPINSPTMRHAQSAAVSSTRNLFPAPNLQRMLTRSLIIYNLLTPLFRPNLAIPVLCNRWELRPTAVSVTLAGENIPMVLDSGFCVSPIDHEFYLNEF